MTQVDLIDVQVRDTGTPPPDIEQERAVAIFDLLEANVFRPKEVSAEGPYRLSLGRDADQLTFDLETSGREPAGAFVLSLSPFRQVVKDYFQICQSYADAVKTAAASEIEVLDEGRREIHTEGSRLLRDRMAEKAEIDLDTARRLFTLICVMERDD